MALCDLFAICRAFAAENYNEIGIKRRVIMVGKEGISEVSA